MERFLIKPRPNWQKTVESQGFIFHSAGGEYWHEAACYAFSEAEIFRIEAATNELYARCLDAVEHVLAADRLAEFAIPPAFHAWIKDSWQRNEPALYGRFDLATTPDGSVKMLEFNADTPTSLLEASVIQWYWLQDFNPDLDQFNSIHEKLLAQWQWLAGRGFRRVAFACVQESTEDYMTTAYLLDCATQAGLTTELFDLGDLGWDGAQFVDLREQPLPAVFKLYPWEFMFTETFGSHLPHTLTRWLEPPWKAVLSNKMILKVLWELFPDHPNLLPCYTQPDAFGGDAYVRKPLLSREGANISIHQNGALLAATEGEYGAEGYIYQGYAELPEFAGRRPVVGSWIIGDEAAGIGIRETDGLVHDDRARFVPHYFF